MDRATLFATPVWSFTDAEDAERDRELAGRLVAESEHAPPSARSPGGGWHSAPDLTRRPEACFEDVLRSVVARVEVAFRDAAQDHGATVDLRYRFAVQAWGTVLRHGDHLPVHDHADAHFAAVYYPQAGDADLAMFPDSGKLCVVDPRRGGTAVPGVELFPSQFAIAPQSGLLVVFPGWLQHFVHPYRGGRPRVSISCNVRLELDREPGRRG